VRYDPRPGIHLYVAPRHDCDIPAEEIPDVRQSKAHGRVQGRCTYVRRVQVIQMPYINLNVRSTVDDFSTALQNATSCLKALVSLSRNVSSPAPTSPSSSSSSNVNTEEQTAAARIEVMTRLTSILQRNVRVRYEINMGELVQS
jgi:hypothetical protein